LATTSALLVTVNKACRKLKEDLKAKCPKKKIERKTDAGCEINMILKAIPLLQAENERLKAVKDDSALLTAEERYFPADADSNENVAKLRKLIAQHDGQGTASESGVSLAASESTTEPKQAESSESTTTTVAEAVADSSVSAVSAAEASQSATAADAAASSDTSSSTTASATSEPAPEVAVASSSESSSSSSSDATAAAASLKAAESTEVAEMKEKTKEADESTSETVSDLLIEAEAIISDAPEVKPMADYHAMTAEELFQEAKRFKTHAQKDKFIATLIEHLAGKKESKADAKKAEAKKDEKEDVKENVKEEKKSEKTFVVEDVSPFTRKRAGVVEVLVKWKGYGVDEMTWEEKKASLTRPSDNRFFVADDKSYKKFCERMQANDQEACKTIEKKDCKKRNKAKGKKEEEPCSDVEYSEEAVEEETKATVQDATSDSDLEPGTSIVESVKSDESVSGSSDTESDKEE